MKAPYWSRPPAELLEAMGTAARTGLTAAAARERLVRYGANRIRDRGAASWWRLLARQFASPLVLILVFAVFVSTVAGEHADAAIILLIVAASGMLGFVQEHSAGAAVERLRAKVAPNARVLRGGAVPQIPASDVVPGDILLLWAGSLIPADAVLLEARDFFVNQAVLTGEPFPVEKTAGVVAEGAGPAEQTNTVFMGSNVRSGTARALVIETGAGTEFGRIAQRLESRPPKTGFERGLDAFGLMLTQVMVALVLVVFAANVFNTKPAAESLLFAIALAVGLAPELLPAIFTVTLAKGAQAMAAHGVVIRRLNAIEDLGSMDILCSDKTGTLTEGTAELAGAFDATGRLSDETLRLAILNARFQTGLSNVLDEALARVIGPAAEDLNAWSKLDEIPYDFVRKRLSIVVQRSGEDTPMVITKGAFDRIVEICTGGEAYFAGLRERYLAWTAQGYRVLGVAAGRLPPRPRYGREVESGLSFSGFLLFRDPPKAGAAQTIRDLTALGVTLKIITGDSRGVAIHVAEAVNLPATRILTGADLRGMGNDALWHAAEQTHLFVEMDPSQKERVIQALRKTGHVVGFLGDGINDAPALHAADVGISVDSAVDVAKEAACMVLLRHDLGALRAGIEEGRKTFANTLKYIFTTVSANFGNMLSMAAASLFLPFLPLLAKQILLNNFLSDIPGITIAADDVDRGWISRPRRWDIGFLRRFMIAFGLVSAVFDCLTFVLLRAVLNAPPEVFRTAWFIESLLTELVIALVVRTAGPFYRSRPAPALLWSTVAVIVMTLVIPFLPGSDYFGFVPLSAGLMGTIAGITGLYVVATEILKRRFYAEGR